MARHTHQQRRDQRGAPHQPQRDQKTTGEGEGTYTCVQSQYCVCVYMYIYMTAFTGKSTYKCLAKTTMWHRIGC